MSRSPRRSSRFPYAARRVAILVALLVAALASTPTGTAAQLSRPLPDSLSDREFWHLFTTLSEESGTFASENFVSNEQTFQHVIPSLKGTLAPGGVYLGVGPEQNFTYIANLEPRMAVIFDIRRQNAMAHLMYKALFELSSTRVEFVSRLFSRPLAATLTTSASPAELFAAAKSARQSDSLFDANWNTIVDLLTVKHGFALSDADLRSIRHVYTAFFEAGPEINYGYRLGMIPSFAPRYTTFADLQNLTNADGVNMAFLSSETNYHRLRALQRKNLVVPVVGDFAGPKAIRGVGEYLRDRGGVVTAFYLSNVEQYLFRDQRLAERFYRNVETLPVDLTSMFIRSVPAGGGVPFTMTAPAGPPAVVLNGNNYYSVQVVDSGGVKVVTTTTDSAGRTVTTRRVDSSNTQSALSVFRSLRSRDDSLARTRLDSLAGRFGRDSALFGAMTNFSSSFTTRTFAVRAVGGMGSLVSGTAPIRAMLDAFARGELTTYAQAIALTKTDGWKQPR